MSKSIKNEFPIGVSLDPNRTFMMFVNTIDSLADITEASPEAIKKISEVDENSKTTTIWGCGLPLPNTMIDAQSHSWEQSDSAVSGIVSKGVDILDNAISTSFDVGKVVKELAYRAGMRQPTINPLYWQNYTGSEPRTFSFAWDLVPRSKEEGDQMVEILRKLKQYSSPKLAVGGLSLLSPYTFDVSISNGKIDSVLKLKNMAIKTLDINYMADGGAQFHYDGTPKHVTLTMQLVELRTIVADDYDGTGVGGLHESHGSLSGVTKSAYGMVSGFFQRGSEE